MALTLHRKFRDILCRVFWRAWTAGLLRRQRHIRMAIIADRRAARRFVVTPMLQEIAPHENARDRFPRRGLKIPCDGEDMQVICPTCQTICWPDEKQGLLESPGRRSIDSVPVRSGQAPAADYATMNIAITALAINAE